MNITFSNKNLQRLANDDRKRMKTMGKIRAHKFKLRLTQIHNAESLEDVRNLPGNYHELTKNRKGQWACDLDQPFRLIIEPHENPVPTDHDGKYVWFKIKGVEVIEIIDYHKEK